MFTTISEQSVKRILENRRTQSRKMNKLRPVIKHDGTRRIRCASQNEFQR